MKKILLVLLLPIIGFAHMKIAVSYPYIGALTKSIGAEHLKTVVLAKGAWDPHFIIPRPSLIAKMRTADALILNGASLEIGWLPPLMRRANNTKVQLGSSRLLDLSQQVKLINIPKNVSRAGGDVHPEGNPHFHLDPYNIPKLALAIKDFLSRIDSEHKSIYETNYNQLIKKWKKNLKKWDVVMKKKKGLKVIQFHDNLAYFNKRYRIKSIATIEPLPGIPPSSQHTLKLIKIIESEKPCCILHDVYHSTKTAKYLANKTNIDIILMPHDIGAMNKITDLEKLFDYLTSKI